MGSAPRRPGEFCAAELAVLTGRSVGAAATLIADALDLRHRLPLLWAALEAGTVRAWQARHVAKRTRATGLTLAQARDVDRTTTPYLATLPWGRFLDLLEARIIAADPAAAEARREAAELDRFVVTGQSTEHGLKTLIAKATAGEVIYLVAMVDRLAQILELEGDQSPVGVRRSKALGHPGPPGPRPGPAPQVRGPDSVVEERACEASSVVEERACERLETTAPDTIPLPPATLYVHVSRESMQTGEGVARMEGVGPITLGQASEFLRHSHVTIKPVIDLDADVPVDSYEVPAPACASCSTSAPPPAPSRGPRRRHAGWTSTTPRRGLDADHPGRPGSGTSASSPGSSTAPRPTAPAGDTDNPSQASTSGEHRTATGSASTRTGTHALGRGLDKLDHPTARTPLERAFATVLAR